MRAGAMDSEIVVQRFTVTGDDGYGNQIEAWADLVTLRAQVIQASTEEFIRNYGTMDETAIVFRTWYVDDIANSDRVVYDGEIFNVRETKKIGRRKGLEIRAISTGADA